MRYTINLDCKNKHVCKDGTIPILLRISLNGKHDYINIGKRMPETFYDREEKKIASKKGAETYREAVDRHKQILTNIINEHEKRNEIMSLSRLKELYKKQTEGHKDDCFLTFVEERMRFEESNEMIKKSTLTNYRGSFKRLKKYKNRVSIYDINVKFMEEFKSYLLTKRKLAENTVYHAMSFMRKYCLQLVNEGLLPQNPIANFVVGNPVEVDLEYLEPDELLKLYELYQSKELLNYEKPKTSKYSKKVEDGKKMHQVLQYLLVACFTGLRHSDIKTLIPKEIKGNEIVKNMQKVRKGTIKTVRIPIVKMLHKIIDVQNSKKTLFDSPVFSNSHSNKYIKKIFEYAKIEKHLTFHKARYTFAINSLILGVSIIVVSDVMGHSSLTTTSRYAKVVDKIRYNEMHKWDVFGTNVEPENKLVINCSNCQQLLLETQKEIIKQKTIRCVCPNCSEETVQQIE